MNDTTIEDEVAGPPLTEGPPVPPLLMCTARPGQLRIGPTLTESLLVIELAEGETLDEALKRKGFTRRYDWVRDAAGSWTIVVKVDEP